MDYRAAGWLDRCGLGMVRCGVARMRECLYFDEQPLHTRAGSFYWDNRCSKAQSQYCVRNPGEGVHGGRGGLRRSGGGRGGRGALSGGRGGDGRTHRGRVPPVPMLDLSGAIHGSGPGAARALRASKAATKSTRGKHDRRRRRGRSQSRKHKYGCLSANGRSTGSGHISKRQQVQGTGRAEKLYRGQWS